MGNTCDFPFTVNLASGDMETANLRLHLIQGLLTGNYTFKTVFDAVTSELKVAFLGDQLLGDPAKLLLRMIVAEDTDMVLHQGDFDYEDRPEAWDQMISDILGTDFPYFASIGNHDIVA